MTNKGVKILRRGSTNFAKYLPDSVNVQRRRTGLKKKLSLKKAELQAAKEERTIEQQALHLNDECDGPEADCPEHSNCRPPPYGGVPLCLCRPPFFEQNDKCTSHRQ